MKRSRPDGNGDQELVELAALADGSLAPERRAALEAEVAASPQLAALLAEQQRAVSYAGGAAAEVEAPAGVRARIEAQRQPRRTARWRGVALAGAVAATAVAALVIGLRLSGPASAQHFSAALGPTALEPAANGRATLTKTPSGWRIRLTATGLPRLDRGRFYEAWLRNAAGVLVPIGTFNDGRNVTLWAGVSPIDFPTLSVTREQADGDQTSSGEKVLVGPVDTRG